MNLSEWITLAGEAVDVFGVIVIIGGIILVTGRYAVQRFIHHQPAYHPYRRGLGQVLLLGLELLVAADIIRTVAVTPTLDRVLTLALIVLIRTFLSWSLEVEVSGRFPWQRDEKPAQRHADDNHQPTEQLSG